MHTAFILVGENNREAFLGGGGRGSGGGGGHGHSHGEEFMGDEDENQNTWKRKVLALVSLCAGVLGMGLIGLGE